MSETYAYNPLRENQAIRFVRLMPASGGPVHCQIFRATLDDKTEFTALSYAWGSTKKTKTIVCNGRKLSITESLMSALLRLRLQDEPRVFWIDAICINQDDIAERNHQVSLIREIYMKAQQLVIWLGAGDQYSTTAVNLMRTLAEAQQNLMTTGIYKACNASREQWLAFAKFLQRSWFDRMWVIQELAFSEKEATIFLCGNHKFKVDILKDACDWCNQVLFHMEGNQEHRVILDEVISGAKRVLVLCDLTNNTTPEEVRSGLWRQWLLSRLAETRDKKSTDPRDRLFALYGFIHHEGQPLAVADYSKDVGTVFQEFARDYMLSCKSLDVLGEVEESSQSEIRSVSPKMPSWVPDWSVNTLRTPLLRLASNLGSKRSKDQASGSVEPVIHALNENVLLVDGILFDTIATVSDPLTTEQLKRITSDQNSLHILIHLWETVVAELDPHPCGATAIEAYYKTLICGREDGDKHVMNFVAFWKFIKAPEEDLPNFCISTQEVVKLLCERSVGANLLHQMHEMCETEHALSSLKMDDIFANSPISASPSRAVMFGQRDFKPTPVRGRSPMPGGSKGHKRSLSAQLRYLSHKRFRDLVVASAGNRVLITTEKGYMGMGVIGTRVGDKVSILSGGKTPTILRKAEITDKRQLEKKAPRSPISALKKHSFVATVVGEAYMHGIMHGQATKNAQWDRIALV